MIIKLQFNKRFEGQISNRTNWEGTTNIVCKRVFAGNKAYAEVSEPRKPMSKM